VYVFETIFSVHIILQFFKEFQPDYQIQPERDLYKISLNYLKGDFALDFVTILPLQFFEFKRNRQTLFYMIKCIRISKGFEIYNVQVFMKVIHEKLT
jgi:hypothetical protein